MKQAAKQAVFFYVLLAFLVNAQLSAAELTARQLPRAILRFKGATAMDEELELLILHIRTQHVIAMIQKRREAERGQSSD